MGGSGEATWGRGVATAPPLAGKHSWSRGFAHPLTGKPSPSISVLAPVNWFCCCVQQHWVLFFPFKLIKNLKSGPHVPKLGPSMSHVCFKLVPLHVKLSMFEKNQKNIYVLGGPRGMSPIPSLSQPACHALPFQISPFPNQRERVQSFSQNLSSLSLQPTPNPNGTENKSPLADFCWLFAANTSHSSR